MFKANRIISLGFGLILLTSFIFVGAGCGKGEVNTDIKLSTEEFYAKYCPSVMTHKPDLYNSVKECIGVQSPGEKQLYLSCMNELNDEKKCQQRRWDNWRKIFLKNLAGVEK